jgi:hypothetical protein
VFSDRAAWALAPNELTRLLAQKQNASVEILDLTESNPTRAGFHYPDEIIAALATRESLLYTPSPRGLETARAAVATEHGVAEARVFLTASTSEAYSYLFKLLLNPGDRVLTPRPSYPLLEFLLKLECAGMDQYPLRYDGSWSIDFHALEALLTPQTRAVVVVNPNNPTGSFLKRGEVEKLAAICASRGMALISDEVFSAYALNPRPTTAPSLTDLNCGLVAVLNGLSKFAGLPQMKAGWMILGGEEKLWRDAADRLELIADTFLSVSTPVQTALTELLRLGKGVQAEIRARTRANLEWLQKHRRPLEVEGGWYAVLPLPDSNAEDRFVVSLLAEDDVLVQPGFFFDFPSEGFVVLSLLTKPETFQEGVLRLVKRIER